MGMSMKRQKPSTTSITLAAQADIHHLYQESVQDPEHAVDLIDGIYRAKRGRKPRRLREDFCGTAFTSAQWVRSHREREAVGIDLDQPTLNWGSEHNVEPLGKRKDRVSLVNCDVLNPRAPGDFDIVCAFNFSYCVFHNRGDLLRYFRNVLRSLDDQGVFVLDLHGGPDSQFELEESTEHDGFTYVWDQGPFDPINNHTVNRIHFRFTDGSELRDAFVYDWRVWSLPELRDALAEAGFNSVMTWWDGDDDLIRPAQKATNYESWVAHLAAWKS